MTDPSPDSSLSEALVGGVAGGVGGSLLLVIIVLVVIVCVLVCQVRRRGHAKFNVSGKVKIFSSQKSYFCSHVRLNYKKQPNM